MSELRCFNKVWFPITDDNQQCLKMHQDIFHIIKNWIQKYEFSSVSSVIWKAILNGASKVEDLSSKMKKDSLVEKQKYYN